MTTSAATLSTTYVPSGRIAWHAPLKLVAYGGLGAVLLAAVYTVVIRYNPLIYFSCIATFIFGALLGIAAASAAEAGHSRSRAFNAFAGLAVGLFGLWVHWLMWTWLMYADGLETVKHLAPSGPSGWADYLSFTANNRHMTIGRLGRTGADETPTFMMWTWALEALAVIVVAVFSAGVTLNSKPFSEARQQWTRTDWEGELPVMSPDAAREVGREIDMHGVDWLAALRHDPQLNDEKTQSTMIKLTCVSAPDDPACAFISVSTVKPKGSKAPAAVTVIENRRVEAQAYARLVASLKA